MNSLEALLYEATTLLLLPALAGLLVLLTTTLLAFGGFLRELLERRRGAHRQIADPTRPRDQRWRALCDGTGRAGVCARFAAAARALGDDSVQLNAVVDACEVAAGGAVSRLHLVARAGPTLGLMATLIPMGPALLALADDDVGALARSLVVAFTATIVGLLIGLLGAVMGTVRRHWYAADLAAIGGLLDIGDEVRR